MRKFTEFLAGTLCGIAITAVLATGGAAPPADRDSAELKRLYDEDQSDRTETGGKAVDWAVVGPRDRAREARVMELYKSETLKTGKDYYHAAMILQHAPGPDKQLLGHEFCIVAIGKGDRNAKWLCAATEDRFLMNIDRPQRFATQFHGSSVGGAPIEMKLYRVDPEVTDGLRKEFAVPTLAQSQAREKQMTELFNGKKP